MLNTIFKSLRGTDWELLTGFISPAFFDVVPTFAMARTFAAILKDYVNPNKFEAALEDASKLIPKIDGAIGDRLELRGRAVLELYFRQIFAQDFALLDLRSSAFDFNEPKIVWRPKPIFYVWDKN